MIPFYQLPLIEPLPLPPGASPSQRLEYQRQMEWYRREVRERNKQMNWDLALHLVIFGILALFALTFFAVAIYYTAGIRGIAITITAGLLIWLAVVEVQRRL